MSFINNFMSLDLLVYVTTFLGFLVYMFNGSNKQATRMPPGPKPLPVIGNLNILDLKKPFQSFMELSEKYGDIFTIQFGPKKMVVISGYKAVKEALVTKAHDFGERADIPIFKLLTQGNGIVFSHGESWKVMRRFTLSTLRDFGMGKKTIENRIQDELDPLLKHYMSYNGKPFDTKIILNSAVSNVICSIIFGKRFEYDDPTFLTLIQLIHANTKMLGTPLLQLYNCYPLLGYLFGAHKKVFKNVELLKNFLRKYIQEHRSEYNTNNITGFIDAFLMKQEQESSNSNTYFHDENLMLSVVDLFAAGTETTSTTLYWGLLLMIKYPEIQSKPFDPKIIINSAVSNVICSIIFGKRFEYDDPIFLKLIHIMSENAKLLGTPRLLLYNFYPVLGSLLGAENKVVKNVDTLKSFFSKFVQEHRLEFNANNITGFIDAFLMKQEQESSNSDTQFHDDNLIYSVLDLFVAGTETSSTTLRWGLLLMMKYPKIQKKIQEEIKMHIKPGQMPTVDDRKNMPYTDAVIHEMQRFANIVPLNVSRMTVKDVEFRGFHIPRGTEVIPFLTSVLYDKTQWKTPNKFNPHHFLDANGKFVKHEAFMPFSAGRRACVGESLAKMELFLFFTGLLQRFTFRPPTGISEEDLDLTADVGFTLTPMPFKFCAVPNY